MPKVVDHEQRRDQLIDAVWELIIDSGIEGITIRRVAQGSGWSSGALRHYLPTREAILDAAAQRVAEVLEQRIRAVKPGPDPLDALIGVLAAVLPTDEPSRRASQVWLAFVGRAAGDEGLDDIRGIVYRDLHAVLVGLLEQLAASGHAVDGGVSAAARELQALIDGLTLHVLLGRVPAGSAERIVRAAVRRLVTRS